MGKFQGLFLSRITLRSRNVIETNPANPSRQLQIQKLGSDYLDEVSFDSFVPMRLLVNEEWENEIVFLSPGRKLASHRPEEEDICKRKVMQVNRRNTRIWYISQLKETYQKSSYTLLKVDHFEENETILQKKKF